MMLLSLIACPAERLGVELPRGGSEAISMEDLHRDVQLLAKGDPSRGLRERFTQMHADEVRAGEGWVCARREGPGPGRLLRASWPTPADVAARAGAAALVSLAKGWDGAAMRRDTWLCAAQPGAVLPPEVEGLEALPVAPVRADAHEPSVDWHVVRDDVKALFLRLEG
jgi:hypothetical protein